MGYIPQNWATSSLLVKRDTQYGNDQRQSGFMYEILRVGTCRLNGTRGSRVKKSVTLCQSRRCRVTHHCSGLGEKQAQAQEGDRASISQLCSPNHVAEGVFRRSEVAGKDLNNTGDKCGEKMGCRADSTFLFSSDRQFEATSAALPWPLMSMHRPCD